MRHLSRLLAIFLALVAPGGACAYIFEVSEFGYDTYWPSLRASPPIPLQFDFNRLGSTRLGGVLPDNTALLGRLGASFTSWAAVETATVRFRPPRTSDLSALAYDQVNLVVFTSVNDEGFSGADGPYIIGLTTTSFDPLNGRMVDADIQFNDTSRFFHLTLDGNTGDGVPGTPGATYINLQDVATHEVGHALGLDHGGILNTTMYFAATSGASRLSTDDKAGISVLYPAPGFRNATGIVEGRITRFGDPVFGAHVVAVDVRTGQPTVSALTARNGSYRIVGLPPGRYVMEAEPVVPNALGLYYENIVRSFPVTLRTSDTAGLLDVIHVTAGSTTAGVDIDAEDGIRNTDLPITADTALPVAPGQVIARVLPPGSTRHPHDLIRFQGTAGARIIANVVAYRLWIPVDPTLELLDANLNVIAGPTTDLSTVVPENLDDRLSVLLPFDGTYYVRVKTRGISSDSFPDYRSVKSGSSLYVLSLEEERPNRPPEILIPEADLRFRVQESGNGREADIVVDLDGKGSDPEDPEETLRWAVQGLPSDLLEVDEDALGDPIPRLVLRPRAHRSGQGDFMLTLIDRGGAVASIPVQVVVDSVDDPPRVDLDLPEGIDGGEVSPGRFRIDAGATTAGPAGDLAEAGQEITHTFTQLGGPPLDLVAEADGSRVTLAPRRAGAYRLRYHAAQVGGANLATEEEISFSVRNIPPRAGPVAPIVVRPGAPVTLDATLSSDLNEELPAEAFALVPRTYTPADVRSGAAGVFTFTAPASPGAHVMEVTVTDSGYLEADGSVSGVLRSSTEVLLVVQDTGNSVGRADAGPDRVVAAGSGVTLAGRAWPAVDPMTFLWTADPGNPAPVALAGAATARASFEVPRTTGHYLFHLSVTEAGGPSSPPDTVKITVVDPSAPAGSLPSAIARVLVHDDRDRDQVVDVGERVVLDGMGSSDPGGRTLSWRWRAPLGFAVPELTGSTPLLEPVVDGTYVIELETGAGNGVSSPARLELSVGEDPPDAPVFTVTEGTTNILSPDDDGGWHVSGSATLGIRAAVSGGIAPLSYHWEQLEGPWVPLTPDGDGQTVTFLTAGPGLYAFEVVVRDARGRLSSGRVDVAVLGDGHHIPVARVTAGPTLRLEAGQTATLDGSASGARSGGTGFVLAHHWIQLAGSPAALEGASGPRPVFRPPGAGTYRFSLRAEGTPGSLGPRAAGEITLEVEAPTRAPAAGGTPTAVADTGGGGGGGCQAGGGEGARGGGALVTFLPWIWVLATRRRRVPPARRCPASGRNPVPGDRRAETARRSPVRSPEDGVRRSCGAAFGRDFSCDDPSR